jgi:hypothetical protein
MAKHLSNHQRTRRTTTWWSESDYLRLRERAQRAGAKTVSAYIRAAALAGGEFEMPAFETTRDLRNAVIRLAAALETLPPTNSVNETLAEAKAALGRICRTG